MTAPNEPRNEHNPCLRHDAERLAKILLKMGTRISFITMATGLSANLVRQWNRSICGRKASQGPVPSHAASIIRTRTGQAHASIYAVLACQTDVAGVRDLNPWTIIANYDRYLALAPDLNHALTINDAIVIARDLRSKSATLVRCEVCRVHYLDMETSSLCGCPICALHASHREGGRRCSSRHIEPGTRSAPISTEPLRANSGVR
jgi:hypothetical protein